MDPNEVLERLRAWADEVMAEEDIESREDEAAQRFLALDAWLQRGCAWPRSWEYSHPSRVAE